MNPVSGSGRTRLALGLFIAAHLAGVALEPVAAQDLEPRAFSPAPVGLNFAALGYAYSYGNVVLDPALPISDGEADVHSVLGAYVRTIDFFGMSGKVDAAVPYVAYGKWTGLVEGVPDSTTRSGFGDPLVRLSVNFIGAPALKLPEFAQRKQGAVVGASFQVRMPLGQYDPTKIINLGTNRWTFKPRIGVSQPFGRWIVEGHGTAWFFTDNPDSFGNRISQDPLWALDAHVARLFGTGIWASFDLGYIVGGRTESNGVPSTARQESLRGGATLALPLARRHSIKLGYFFGLYTELGSDFDNLLVVYQYRWGGGI
ncbi:MAG: transporter [marine benthic group bacterium]|nr:transporter [Gemmatimonadota bacterium]